MAGLSHFRQTFPLTQPPTWGTVVPYFLYQNQFSLTILPCRPQSPIRPQLFSSLKATPKVLGIICSHQQETPIFRQPTASALLCHQPALPSSSFWTHLFNYVFKIKTLLKHMCFQNPNMWNKYKAGRSGMWMCIYLSACLWAFPYACAHAQGPLSTSPWLKWAIRHLFPENFSLSSGLGFQQVYFVMRLWPYGHSWLV